MIELDVHLTKDKKVVVFHDHTLKRVCGVEGKISDCLYADLPKVNIIQSSQTKNLNEQQIKERTSIPLFEEVLQILPTELCLIVEFKDKSPELIKQVYDLLVKYKKIQNQTVVWFGLQKEINQALREFEPKVPTISSIQEMLSTSFFFHIGLLPFLPVNYQVHGIPCDKIDGERIHRNLKSVPKWFCDFLALLIGGDPPKFFISPNLNNHLRKRGIAVWVLGVNNDHAINIGFESNSTGLVSDRPKWLNEKLQSQKHLRILKNVVL
eukprot:c19739_g1_i1.p1 GENE.c19739_g1_i1~~c19739_g1_i1.p1  ORF type:complete len:266 (-),score=115.18 c19739_g1_i1:35-832(-)